MRVFHLLSLRGFEWNAQETLSEKKLNTFLTGRQVYLNILSTSTIMTTTKQTTKKQKLWERPDFWDSIPKKTDLDLKEDRPVCWPRDRHAQEAHASLVLADAVSTFVLSLHLLRIRNVCYTPQDQKCSSHTWRSKIVITHLKIRNCRHTPDGSKLSLYTWSSETVVTPEDQKL